MKTYERKGERFLKFEEKEYLVEDFLISHESLLELRIIEFDHLSEEEQRERGLLREDEKYIPKINRVAQFNKEEEKRREAKKCQHLCGKCHVIKTKSTYEYKYKPNNKTKEKMDYVNSLKICGCENCKYKDETLLQFFEMDHLNPKSKLYVVSKMVRDSKYTLEDVKRECEKCRVLCRHCHIIHTHDQIKNGII